MVLRSFFFRFVFHDNSSSKLDNRVEFPLSGLNLQPYVASVDISSNSDNTGDDCMYDLYGVVCHFGSKYLNNLDIWCFVFNNIIVFQQLLQRRIFGSLYGIHSTRQFKRLALLQWWNGVVASTAGGGFQSRLCALLSETGDIFFLQLLSSIRRNGRGQCLWQMRLHRRIRK